MIKCRICLEAKGNVCSIYETDQGLSYASMITLITGKKIANNEECNVICLQCRRRLIDFLEFKHLIERSDMVFSKQSKIFKFNTIEDLKEEFSPEFKYNKLGYVHLEKNVLFQNESDCIYYNNTLIRRLKIDERNCIPIDQFLNTIKKESLEEIDYVGNCDQNLMKNEEYACKSKKKTTKKVKTIDKDVKPLKQVNNIRIKPILLNDLRVIKAKSVKVKKKSKIGHRLKEKLCPFCGKITKSIKTHILLHTGEKKYKCSTCSKSFLTSTHRLYHMKKTHSNIKETFKCDHCIFIGSTRISIVRHMTTHMQQNMQFNCIVCNKEFKRKNGLQRHMRIHDISARSVQCDVCQMKFVSKCNLKNHSRVHTGERPYKCELCSQPYSYKRDFNRHCLKKHGVVVDRRPVYVMNEQILKKEKALMKDLMLRLHGIPTENDPLDSFSGPQMGQAFAKAVKLMQNGHIPIDVNL